MANSPEFKEAVRQAAVEAISAELPGLLAQLAETKAVTSARPSDTPFVQALAMQLAELTSQNSGRIYVAPEIIEKRKMARDELTQLLLDLHGKAMAFGAEHPGEENPHVPAYRLRAKTQLDLGALGPILVDPMERDQDKVVRPTEIDWPGMPNQAMEPINSAAEQVYRLFRLSLDDMMPEPDPLYAVTANGAVVRGAAAAAVARNTRQTLTGELGFGERSPEQPHAAIRRRDGGPKEMVQVLGTLTKPIEVR